jgi:hypothetical protein
MIGVIGVIRVRILKVQKQPAGTLPLSYLVQERL